MVGRAPIRVTRGVGVAVGTLAFVPSRTVAEKRHLLSQSSRGTHRGRVAAIVGLVLGLSMVFGATSLAAQTTSGAERIVAFKSDIEVLADRASVRITETIDYDFGYTERHGIERFVPVVFPFTPKAGSKLDDGIERERVTEMTDIAVRTSQDTPGDVEERDEGSFHVLRIGDKDETITGRHRYEITYVLHNVFNTFDDHDELYLNVTGDQWDVPIDAAAATVTTPVAPMKTVCFAGPAGSSLPCTGTTGDGVTTRFEQAALGANQGLTVVVALPKGTIPNPAPVLRDKKSVINALRPTIGAGLGGAGVLLAGLAGISFLLWRHARDVQYSGSAVDAAFGNTSGGEQRVPVFRRDGQPVEFVPPGGVRPGHMGTLWDEIAHPLDVSAMIIDLAVRGWLRIEEVEAPADGFLGIGHREGDYRFVRLRNDTEGLLKAEQLLMSSIFRDGDQIVLSDLRQHFAERLELVEGALYDDTVAAGWFPIRPDRVRARWRGRAVLLLIVGAGITVVTFIFRVRWVALGVALLVVGLVLLALADRFPARTAAGTALLGRIRGFKELFDVGEGERQAFAERADLFSAYLPYAIVFGMAERWAATFEALGMSPEQLGVGTWYVSPYGYNAFAFGSAMNSFATTTTGSIAMATPSASGGSGFSGGGFSGGGFGGGGGGSW